MEGIVALAMEKKAPYGITIGAVPGTVETWCADLPRDCHLLYFDVLPDAARAEHYWRNLTEKTSVAEEDFYDVSPHEAIRMFLSLKEYQEAKAGKPQEPESEELSQEQKNLAEGERLLDLAQEYDSGNLKVIKDPKRAFALYKQSAELGFPPAFLYLSWCYSNGDGVKKDLNVAVQWAYKCIEPDVPQSIRLWGFAQVAECFRDAEMRGEAEETWRRCFVEMGQEFIEENSTAIHVISSYGSLVSRNELSAVHPKSITVAFPAAVVLIRKKAEGRELSTVEKTNIYWLKVNSPS